MLDWLNRLKLLLANSAGRKPKAVTVDGLQFAFNCGGRPFYKWPTVESMPVLRLMMAKDYLDALHIGAEKGDIIAYINTVAEAMNANTVNRANIAVISSQLEQRLKMVTNTEILYKLAAVYYVEAGEKKEVITIEEVEEKADFFKASMPIDDFFLTTRLVDFLPAGSISSLNLKAFSRAEQIERKERLTSLMLYLSSLTNKESDTSTYIKSELSKLQK